MGIKRPNQDMPSFAEMRKRLSPKADFLGRTAQDAPARSETRPAAVVVPARKDIAAKPGNGAQARPRPAKDARDTAVLKGRVHYPAQGHSKKFDAAVKAYGEKEALQLFLKSALPAYADALNTGDIPAPPADYPRGQGDLNVSRAMDAQAFAKARAMLDPMEMMGAATLAARILRNALAWRLAQG